MARWGGRDPPRCALARAGPKLRCVTVRTTCRTLLAFRCDLIFRCDLVIHSEVIPQLSEIAADLV